MVDRKTYLANQIAKYSQKLDAKGFGANHDGNISARFENVLLATPTSESKGNIVADTVITLDMCGNKIAGIGKPFSEIKLHLAAYSARPEVKAVVHAHPPYTTARGLLNLPLYPQLPEAIVSLGDVIPVAEFAMPGDVKNDAIIADMVSCSDVFMLPGNGLFAVGDCVEQAYLRLELAEHLAKIQYYVDVMRNANIAGANQNLLSPEDVAKLMAKRAAIGLGPKKKPVAKSISDDSDNNLIKIQNSIAASNGGNNDAQFVAMIKEIIAAEIKNIL